mmetsp:Transcript_67590/g.124388  ORF Transcript_67590/g.124388 Transcript_67590/m.124388 type:complete len:244 (+) Transcript_67590:99-830(+)
MWAVARLGFAQLRALSAEAWARCLALEAAASARVLAHQLFLHRVSVAGRASSIEAVTQGRTALRVRTTITVPALAVAAVPSQRHRRGAAQRAREHPRSIQHGVPRLSARNRVAGKSSMVHLRPQKSVERLHWSGSLRGIRCHLPCRRKSWHCKEALQDSVAVRAKEHSRGMKRRVKARLLTQTSDKWRSKLSLTSSSPELVSGWKLPSASHWQWRPSSIRTFRHSRSFSTVSRRPCRSFWSER